MKYRLQNSFSILLLLNIFFAPHLYGHGFAERTLIKRCHYAWAIAQILTNPYREKISVLSYNRHSNQLILQPVHIAGCSNASCYCDLRITDGNEHTDEVINANPGIFSSKNGSMGTCLQTQVWRCSPEC